ncbi:aldehyde dehydrogenase [Streptomyces sp. NPDC088183]|uniref:aldehyde dehydrogenase n=1 Tax=Streptomyces sp. NPDC088183 TaxID=3160992 RepID=UPI0034352C0B
MEFFGHVVDGRESTEDECGAVADSVDPWTRRPWARFPLGGEADAGRAVAAARRAFDTGPWPRMGFAERGAALHRLAGLIEAHGQELGLADTHDMGKPLTQSRDADVPRAAANFRFFADHARLATAEVLPMDSGHHCYGRFEAAGVVAAVAPWNFPLMLASWKVAPALAWGNTVVLKPAEGSPASATLLARLALEAGLPAGVLNVLQGLGPDAGAALTRDPRVDRITFTGSSRTGRSVAAAAASHLAPVSLELGGKGANLVFADADLDLAVDWAVKAAFSNAGQICLAGSRVLVQRPVYEEFTARFVRAAEAMTVGDPLAPETQIGPLASEQHFRKVSGHLAEAGPGRAATLATGGLGEGWSVRPTVLTEVSADSPLWREEIFGPVVAAAPFDDEKQAVVAANDTPYGLNAMLFTADLDRAHRVSAALRAGTVWVNCFFVRDLRAPFGGAGDSGIGREGGAFSREFFTEPKAVVMRIGAEPRD